MGESVQASNAHDKTALAAAATGIGIGLNLTNRALSAARIVAATPHAYSNHNMVQWTLQLMMQKSTNDVVPNVGGKLNLGLFAINNSWQRAFQTSQGLKLIAIPVTLLVAGPNLWDAYFNHGGVKGFYESRSGRTGVATGIATAAQGYFLYKAANNVLKAGTVNMAARHGVGGKIGGAGSFLAKMIDQKFLGSWKVVGWSVAAYSVAIANEVGALDFLDKGNKRPMDEVLSDALHEAGKKITNFPGDVVGTPGKIIKWATGD